MANLQTKRWQRYVPDIGDNRDLPDGERLELEVRTGLTRAELRAFVEAMAELKRPLVEKSQAILAELKAGTIDASTADARMTEAVTASDVAAVGMLAENIRVVGRHTINDKPIESMSDYCGVMSELAGTGAMKELIAVVSRVNSFTEEDALFSERLSGGLASTPRRSAAKNDEKTAAR